MAEYAPWLIVLAALIWGAEGPLRKFLTQDLPSSIIVLSEHAVIALIATPIFIARRSELKLISVKVWACLLFIALGGSTLATMLFTESFRHTNPSVSILLQKTQPFIAFALAALILKEKLSPTFYAWAVVAASGAALLSLPELKLDSLEPSGGSKGVALALAAASLWAGSTVLGKYALARVSFATVASLRFLLALSFLLLINLLGGRMGEVYAISQKDILYISALAVIAGFVAIFVYYRGLQDTRASICAIAELIWPLSAVVINWVVLDARLNPTQMIGGAALLLSIHRVSRMNH